MIETPAHFYGLAVANLYRLGLAHRWDESLLLRKRESFLRLSALGSGSHALGPEYTRS